MKLLAVLTESHRELYEKHFLPSLPDGFDLVTHRMDLEGDGSYESGIWQAGVVQKLKFALDHVSRNRDSVFVLSDVDIQFFDSFSTAGLENQLKRSGCEILFQRETADTGSAEVNTGFYIARCGDFVQELLRNAITECAQHQIANDQTAVNALLHADDRGTKWDLLPPAYYARSHGFPPPRGIAIHHANLTSTVRQKCIQLGQIRSYSEGGAIRCFMVILRELIRYIGSGSLLGMLARRLKGSQG